MIWHCQESSIKTGQYQ